MTRAELVALRDTPPAGMEPIVRALCSALIAAHDGAPWSDRHIALVLGNASTWLWCDPGLIAQLMHDLQRVSARQPERLL